MTTSYDTYQTTRTTDAKQLALTGVATGNSPFGTGTVASPLFSSNLLGVPFPSIAAINAAYAAGQITQAQMIGLKQASTANAQELDNAARDTARPSHLF